MKMSELKVLHSSVCVLIPPLTSKLEAGQVAQRGRELVCYQVGHCLFVPSIGENLTKSIYNLLY